MDEQGENDDPSGGLGSATAKIVLGERLGPSMSELLPDEAQIPQDEHPSPPAPVAQEMDGVQILHRLYFLRHAPAVLQADWDGADTERPLTAEGRRKLHAARKGLRALIGRPDAIVSSPYVRAYETATLVARDLGFEGAPEKHEGLGHGGDPKHLEDILSSRAHGSRTLLIGHSPDLERWICHLLGGTREASLELRKGGACRIDIRLVDGRPLPVLRWLATPAMLRDMD